MEAVARITSKGQVTIPKAVRDALGVQDGDSLIFRMEGDRAVVAASPDLLDHAGAVDVPLDKRGTPWDEVLRVAHAAQAAQAVDSLR